MSERDSDIIQPLEAPLSHLSKPAAGKRLAVDWRIVAVSLAVAGVLVFAFTWRPEVQPAAPKAPAAADNTDPSAPRARNSDSLAPFAQVQRERAREQAQQALAAFVEQQIQLEENMHVAQWGQQQLDLAMAQAQDGDAEFAAENFAQSLVAYEKAAGTLTDLIAQGERIFDDYVQQTEQHLDSLNADEARVAIQRALDIKADDSYAQQLRARVQHLPEVITLLRTAKNHELGERPAQALEVYNQVAALDPATKGLDQLRAEAAAAQSDNKVAQHLSRGFKLLDNQQFDQARAAFNSALAIEPDNDIAKGGLAQLAKENDLAVIKKHRADAEQAMAAEQWQAAIDAYQAVLKMDRNIQFAANGLGTARAHLKASNLLGKIAGEPHKLSRQQLYLDAIDILNNAKTLEHRGPKLQAAINAVDQLIILYRDPVDVVLVSDNATEVIMSNVGELGRFDRKTLSLRPGQYTIRGSQDGCRDIYMSIEVLPGISPVDVSCQESL